MNIKMRILLILSLALTAGCSALRPGSEQAQTQAPPQLVAIDIPDILDHPFGDTSLYQNDLQQNALDVDQIMTQVDEYHLEVNLSDDLTSLTGEMHVRYINRLEADLSKIVFRLLPNLWGSYMQVNSVSIDNADVAAREENDGTVVVVPLEDPISSGEAIELLLSFSIIIPQDDSGNYGTFGNQAGVIALAQFYPLIPLRDKDGWRTELYPPDGDVTVTEVANYLVRIRAPKDLILAGSGIQIDRAIDKNEQTVTYVSALAREFYLAGSPTYQVQTMTDHAIQYAVYSQAEVASTAKQSLDTLAQAVVIFENLLGEYPYRELECVATPTSAGGVEYPGIMAINQLLFDPDATLSGMSTRDLVESVVVHEVAHEWFYNVVGNDQGREPWLDEAMAQYLTYVYFLDRYGQSAANNYKQSWYTRWDRVQREPIPIGLPVEDYQGREYGAIVYGRGPIFLDELARAMGQTVFNQFLRGYFTTYSWKVATGEEFQSLAETTCNCDLDALFDEWVQMK